MTNTMTDAAVFVVVRCSDGAVVGASARTFYAALDDAQRNSDDPAFATMKVQLPFVKTDYNGHEHGGYRLEERASAQVERIMGLVKAYGHDRFEQGMVECDERATNAKVARLGAASDQSLAAIRTTLAALANPGGA